MATPKSIWGIDIGQCALKALKLRNDNGELQVEAFDIIEHPEILSPQPDAERQQHIRNALEQFLSRNNVTGSAVAVSVPGQSGFTRFVKLPPVESKRIPDIVRFEAEQQIPFAIDEVIWRWQTFHDPDSPDVEVGIFAMKRTDVASMLQHFTDVSLSVDIVQMAPLALYNFMAFDQQVTEDGATLLADVGADKTDLVVADGARIWTRTIRIGGNNFTEALVRAFKLSFAKAEKLKRSAATSKYARQIFQAMRPVFADLVQEIQRSIGYYTSLHRESRFKRMLGLGNGFRLPGLQKFLEQNLGIPVSRIDGYNRLVPPSTNAPTFAENVLSFAVAYGLAIQGIAQPPITTNLLPTAVARKRVWSRKRPWFAAAAAVVLAILAGPMYRAFVDRATLKRGSQLTRAKTAVDEMNRFVNEWNRWKDQGRQEVRQIEDYKKLFAYRDFWPSVQEMVSRSILAVAPDQELITLYARGRDDAARQKVLDKLRDKPRQGRRLVFVQKLTSTLLEDLDDSTCRDVCKKLNITVPGQADRPKTGGEALRGKPGKLSKGGAKQPKRPTYRKKKQRGLGLVIVARTPLPKNVAETLLTNLVQSSRRLHKELDITDFEIVDSEYFFLPTKKTAGLPVGRAIIGIPVRGVVRTPVERKGAKDEQAGPAMPDPMFPDEDMSGDTRFVVVWKLAVDGADKSRSSKK